MKEKIFLKTFQKFSTTYKAKKYFQIVNLFQERKIREKIYQKNVNIYQNKTFFGPKLGHFQEIVPQIEISGVLTKISGTKFSSKRPKFQFEE